MTPTLNAALQVATPDGGQTPLVGVVLILLLVVLYFALLSIPFLLLKMNKRLAELEHRLSSSKSSGGRRPIVGAPTEGGS